MSNKKSMTKSELMNELAEKTELKVKDVKAVFNALEAVLAKELKRGNPVTVAGMFKVVVKNKPAKPARTMKSPFTGEMINVSAKPASKGIKVKAMKVVKEMV